MANLIDSFIEKKKAESVFLTLGDGESVAVNRLKEVKMITKMGFGGEEKEVLRFVCEVETPEGIFDKYFDNGTQRFAKEVQEKGVQIGSRFVITRNGVQTKTRYTISMVDNSGVRQSVQGQVAAAPVAAAPTAASPAPSGVAAALAGLQK